VACHTALDLLSPGWPSLPPSPDDCETFASKTGRRGAVLAISPRMNWASRSRRAPVRREAAWHVLHAPTGGLPPRCSPVLPISLMRCVLARRDCCGPALRIQGFTRVWIRRWPLGAAICRRHRRQDDFPLARSPSARLIWRDHDRENCAVGIRVGASSEMTRPCSDASCRDNTAGSQTFLP
jgi:hypothetical protein